MSETSEEQFTVSIIRDSKTGKPLHETWRNAAGQLERHDDLPAWIEHNTDGIGVHQWFQKGQLSRAKNKPALTMFNVKSGVVFNEEYFVNGVHHRTDNGPTIISRSYYSGAVERIEYHKDGKLHRTRGPAFQMFDDVGREFTRTYYKHGEYILRPDTLDP